MQKKTRKSSNVSAKRLKTKGGAWVIVSHKKQKSGDTHWVVRNGARGNLKTMKSSSSSNTAIDAAMSKYGRALRRLADR